MNHKAEAEKLLTEIYGLMPHAAGHEGFTNRIKMLSQLAHTHAILAQEK
jgi:hypothetical protein